MVSKMVKCLLTPSRKTCIFTVDLRVLHIHNDRWISIFSCIVPYQFQPTGGGGCLVPLGCEWGRGAAPREAPARLCSPRSGRSSRQSPAWILQLPSLSTLLTPNCNRISTEHLEKAWLNAFEISAYRRIL